MSKTMINLDEIDAIINKHKDKGSTWSLLEELDKGEPVEPDTSLLSYWDIVEAQAKEFESMLTIVDVDIGSKVQEEWDAELMARRNMLTVISGKG